ncbi:hypothetical protein C8F01DRAFT_1145501 [Mycena amicta]|nr:hypothetical protein C8F01DRAFT_1145501 [Mycena amicta]
MEDPRLPPELEREVCELTALMHPETVPTLIRVAQRIHEWTEPFLYRTVRVRPSRHFDAFLRALRTKPPSFLAASVRNIHFESVPECTYELCLEIISKCPGIIRLGTTRVFTGPRTLEPLNTLRNVRHLALSLCPLFQGPQNVDPAVEPIFAHITHLSLHDTMSSESHQVICSVLPRMPCLTHIRVNSYQLPAEVVRQLLSTCARLEILLATAGSNSLFNGLGYPLGDPRLVWGRTSEWASSYAEFWDDWEKGALGLVDFWALAAEAVERRKRDLSSHNTHRIEWIGPVDGSK